MENQTKYWKILTSDFRPPIQGGDPLCDGRTWPVTLSTVTLDRSASECGNGGWHFCRSIADGFGIAGMWRTGKPNAVILVDPHGDVIERSDKCRAASLDLLRFATPEEIREAITAFSACFGHHQAAMAEEQWLWWQALGRPQRDRDAVAANLRVALEARGLKWTLKEYPVARAAWDAWDAWDARDAWSAWDARDALSVQFTARSGWITQRSDSLTVGIRDAYYYGLAIAVPVGKNELGWAMEAD